MDLYLYSEIVELGDDETGRGGDYEFALDCLICIHTCICISVFIFVCICVYICVCICI